MSVRRSSATTTKKRTGKKTTKRVTKKQVIPKKTMREVEDFYISINHHAYYRERDPQENVPVANDNKDWIAGEVQMMRTLTEYFGVEMWEDHKKRYRKNKKVNRTQKQIEQKLNDEYRKTVDIEDQEFENEKKAKAKGEGFFKLRKKWITGRFTVLRQSANFFDVNLKEQKSK